MSEIFAPFEFFFLRLWRCRFWTAHYEFEFPFHKIMLVKFSINDTLMDINC